MPSERSAFYLIADDRYKSVACGMARRLMDLWQTDVHVFVENEGEPFRDRSGHDRVFVHHNLLKGKRPDGLPVNHHWPAIVYDRIFVPALLSDYKRLIYLDADIYPLTTDTDLLTIPLQGALGAVQDIATVGFSPQVADKDRDVWRDSIGLKTYRYFNSGVLVIDSEVWLKIDFVQELERFMRKHGSAVHMPDQDFMNWLFQDNWTELSPRFNYQKGLFNYGYEDIFPPVFIHFSCCQKPWQSSDNPETVHGQFHQRYRDMIRAGGCDPDQLRGRTADAPIRRFRKSIRHWMSRMGFSVGKERRLRAEWERRAEALSIGFKNDQAVNRYADLDFVLSRMPRPGLHFDGQQLHRALKLKDDGESP